MLFYVPFRAMLGYIWTTNSEGIKWCYAFWCGYYWYVFVCNNTIHGTI